MRRMTFISVTKQGQVASRPVFIDGNTTTLVLHIIAGIGSVGMPFVTLYYGEGAGRILLDKNPGIPISKIIGDDMHPRFVVEPLLETEILALHGKQAVDDIVGAMKLGCRRQLEHFLRRFSDWAMDATGIKQYLDQMPPDHGHRVDEDGFVLL
uniref:Uncharacterized protein n=1 Tax=viral metagenome TaxID=1070528 RepID=A0A6C0CFL5_9ZZZZ